jgi:N,N'-diacetyllegionaminate synthase
MMFNLLEAIDNKVFIIAEIGCNHNGDMAIAKDLIDRSIECGVDAVKFQSFKPQKMTTVNAPKADYQLRATGTSESQFKRLCRMQLTRENHFMVFDYCREKGIQFISTPFDEESVYLLEELGVTLYKVPSGEITNIPLLSMIGAIAKPVILSSGMANLGEIEQALEAVGHNDVALLHCISAYPAKWEDLNLKAIQTLSDTFSLPVGFSDHSQGIEIPMVAVGMGACIIEKHITLDRNMEGGDHWASLEPSEFKEMVSKIRRIEKAMGDGVKRCMPVEKDVRDVARKSIVANRNIAKGQVIQEGDLALKRPGTGISPKYLGKLIGLLAKQEIQEDQVLDWSFVEVPVELELQP